MKSLTWKSGRLFAYVVAMAAVTSVASASSISEANRVYDSTHQLDGNYYSAPGTASTVFEFGDEVNLAQPGKRILENITFNYYLQGGTAGGVFRLYKNDGPIVGGNANAKAPGTMLVENTFAAGTLAQGFASTVSMDFDWAGTPTTMPDSVTWTMTFNNLGAGTVAGLLTTAGTGNGGLGNSANDYWEKDAAGAWAVKQFSGTQIANFSAKISAVPEVGTIQMALVGGLVWLSFFGYRRSRKA